MFNYQLEGMKHAGQITVEAGHNKPKRQVGYHLCRYCGGAAAIDMSARKFTLVGTDSALELDFENISFDSNNVTNSRN